MRQMEREYLPAGLREKYGLAEINYALEHIHFPANREELMFSRKRLVFDEFFMFLMSVRLLKDKKEDKKECISICNFRGNGIGGRAPPICADRGTEKGNPRGVR